MIVFYFACIYWGGVVLNAARIRSRTGKSPSLKPKGARDYVIWVLWFLMIFLWAATPWLVDESRHFFDSRIADIAGIALACAGLAGTWWCYVTMGDAWAISQDKSRTNRLVQSGPFALARHPIYLFQWMIVAGLFLLAPGWSLTVSLLLLTGCMQVKARAEEEGLGEVFGGEYVEYCRKVGRFFPRFGP